MQKLPMKCNQCKLTLLCMTKTWIKGMYWCTTCNGWWLKHHNIFVSCKSFLGTKKLYLFTHNIHRMLHNEDVNSHSAGVTCPLCDDKGLWGDYTPTNIMRANEM
jgi:hypothetical protein